MIRKPLILLAFLAAQPVHANTLYDHEGVNNGLVVAGIVEEIDDQCPSLKVRVVRGALFLRSLHRLAGDAGFTDEEIEAYVDDREQEAFLRQIAQDWLTERGAAQGDPETYCAIGREEMANDTQIGSFLKED